MIAEKTEQRRQANSPLASINETPAADKQRQQAVTWPSPKRKMPVGASNGKPTAGELPPMRRSSASRDQSENGPGHGTSVAQQTGARPASDLSPLEQFRELVKSAVADTADIDAARQKIVRKLAARPALRKSLRDDAERKLIMEAIYDARNWTRDAVKRASPARPCCYTADALAAGAKVIGQSIIDLWTLPIGKVLGDATGAELRVLAESERAISKGHADNAALFVKLADLCGDEGTVRDKVGAKADEIWKSITGGGRSNC